MHLVDTCGWIEWLVDGPLADEFSPFLKETEQLLVPTLVQFELYKWCMRERDEASALEVIGLTESCIVRPLDTRTALTAADISSKYKLAMADAVIYASALNCDALLITAERHFADLPGVRYWPK